jgi:hypothetical protein
MKKLTENFCVAPFIQCTTHPSTSFSPCPYLGGTTWKASGNSILEQWRSTEIEELRQDFINNVKSPVCNRCWHEEENNKKSMRLRLLDPVNSTSDYSFIDPNTYITELLNKVNSKDYLSGPEVLTIKNGNICNAKCRVCHPGDSSRWIADSAKLKQLTGKEYYAIDQSEKNWSDAQLDEILNMSPGLKRLELFGGEPMYNKKVIGLLEKLVSTGHSSHIILYINTNGSVNIVDKIPNIKHFHQVEIGVSIDGIANHFEYIRHGLKYEVVKNNIADWKNYFEEHNVTYFIDCICTVEILNIFYLPEIKSSIMDILPLSPYWNLLVDPAYLFIKNMPDNVKIAVIEKLSQDTEEFEDLINIIKQPSDLNEWNKFLEVTGALDQIRKESFQKTFPEFAKLIF